MLYLLQDNNNACVLFLFFHGFSYFGDKIAEDNFKYEMLSSFREKQRIKLYINVIMYYLRERGKSW